MDVNTFNMPEMGATPPPDPGPQTQQPEAPQPPGAESELEAGPLTGAVQPDLAPTSSADQLQTELDTAMVGNGTKDDFDRFSMNKPQSLGDRARFIALQKKYGGPNAR